MHSIPPTQETLAFARSVPPARPVSSRPSRRQIITLRILVSLIAVTSGVWFYRTIAPTIAFLLDVSVHLVFAATFLLCTLIACAIVALPHLTRLRHPT